MEPEWFRIPRRDNEAVALITELPGGGHRVEMSLPHAGDPLPISALCRSCIKPVRMGMRIRRRDLPLQRSGQWRCHHCGGTAVLPEQYVVIDAGTGERLEVVGPDRATIVVSAITRAELLRLRQAARAVLDQRPGSQERLEHVLQESPDPVRRLRDLRPSTWEQWAALATIVAAVVATLTFILDDGGHVTEQQLVTTIEQLIESQDEGGNADREQQDSGYGGDRGVEPRDIGPTGVDGQWGSKSPDGQAGAERAGEDGQ